MKNVVRALAQAKSIESQQDGKQEKEKKPVTGDKLSVTHHTVNIGGKPFKYKATAGYLEMKDEHHKMKTKMFFIAYEAENPGDIKKRPVTFAFNGGPGACSAWVHFGAMGPKRVVTTDEGKILPPPYQFEDNQHTWLEFTDLVFMDPVGTGYSVHDKDEDPKQYFGVEEDIKSGGDFIRLYVTRFKRWLSPKFIAGESYGTFRAIGLAAYMQRQHALDTNGTILISSVLDFMHLNWNFGNDLPYMLFFPGYAATAWYHNQLTPELQKKPLAEIVSEAERFAENEYCMALMKGDRLPAEERKKTIETMARLTSLSEEFLETNNMRVTVDRFMKQLLRKQRKVTGRYDSRLTTTDVDPASEKYRVDPSFFNIFGACIATLNDYLRNDLKYENDLPYQPLSKEVSKNWNWDSGLEGGMGYVSVMDKLRECLCYNRYMQVFFACGYYDLCTPHFIADYTVNHLNLTPELRENVTLGYYEGGHMMYVHKGSREKLHRDLKEFYQQSACKGVCD